jgi:hypothetical protein
MLAGRIREVGLVALQGEVRDVYRIVVKEDGRIKLSWM